MSKGTQGEAGRAEPPFPGQLLVIRYGTDRTLFVRPLPVPPGPFAALADRDSQDLLAAIASGQRCGSLRINAAVVMHWAVAEVARQP